MELKYYDLVHEALTRDLGAWLETAKQGDGIGIRKFYGTALRLDWELSNEAAEETNAAELMLVTAANDIAELLEHGDVDNNADALLKSIDGSIKRGKELEDVLINSAVYHREYKERKESTEYTIYINISPVFA